MSCACSGVDGFECVANRLNMLYTDAIEAEEECECQCHDEDDNDDNDDVDVDVDDDAHATHF